MKNIDTFIYKYIYICKIKKNNIHIYIHKFSLFYTYTHIYKYICMK